MFLYTLVLSLLYFTIIVTHCNALWYMDWYKPYIITAMLYGIWTGTSHILLALLLPCFMVYGLVQTIYYYCRFIVFRLVIHLAVTRLPQILISTNINIYTAEYNVVGREHQGWGGY